MKKMITIGIAGLLLLTSMLVIPVIGATTSQMIGVSVDTEEAHKAYKKMIEKLEDEDVEDVEDIPIGQIETLCAAVSDPSGEVYLGHLDETLAAEIPAIFNPSSTTEEYSQARDSISKMLKEQNDITNGIRFSKGDLEDAMEKNLKGPDDFEPEHQELVEELYKDVKTELLITHPELGSLVNSAIDTLDDITISLNTLILCAIWIFLYGFASTIPGFDLGFGIVVGAIAAMAAVLLFGPVINALGALVDENLPQWVKDLGVTDTAPVIGAAVFSVVFAGFFLAYELSHIFRGIVGGGVVLGVCLGIYYYFEVYQTDSRSTPATPTLIEALVTWFFTRFPHAFPILRYMIGI